MSGPDRPRLFVCVTCRAGRAPAEGEAVPGRVLHDALARLLAGPAPSVELREIACLANCERGCSAAIAMRGKWGYLLGRLDAALAPDLLAYAAAYAASASGTVLPSRRPASLRHAILGRFPLQEITG